jgi:hypothetical protein
MNKVIFVSDFFIDEILGGAEKCNDALITKLENNKHTVQKIKSKDLNVDTILSNKENLFIVANFMLLSEECKNCLMSNSNYVVYEHDHKYASNNNPAVFKDFVLPSHYIINKDFYRAAKKVICQSNLHAQVVYKNLLLENIINAGANFWSDEDIKTLEENMNNQKEYDYSSYATKNKNKGFVHSIKYCERNNHKLHHIQSSSYEDFIKELSKTKNFVFFPQWLESYSRLAVEARILGCKVITNKLLGVASEDYFNLQGIDLLNIIKNNNEKLINTIEKIISLNDDIDHNFDRKEIPKITISCSLYKGEKFIKGFLEDTVNQTIFDKCELIIINANSPENQEDIIFEYMKKYDNIKYHKLDYVATTTEVINSVISDYATGEYITVGNVDDRRKKDCLEIQAKTLMFNDDVGLVYADCYETGEENQTFEENTSSFKRYQHSLLDFSPENMIKCLPGPMPMWRTNLHKDVGLFSYDYQYANDWDMWLRMVRIGTQFKKIHEVLGLYLFNDKGKSTDKDNFIDKIQEENEIFLRNRDILGEKNFLMYKDYFAQGESQ